MRCSKTIAYQVRSTLIGRDQWILRRRAARIDTLPYRRQRARPDNWTLFTQSTSHPATHDTCQCQHKERTCLFLEKEKQNLWKCVPYQMAERWHVAPFFPWAPLHTEWRRRLPDPSDGSRWSWETRASTCSSRPCPLPNLPFWSFAFSHRMGTVRKAARGDSHSADATFTTA